MVASSNKIYRFDKPIQVIDFKGMRVHVVQVLKLFQQSLMVHSYVCSGSDKIIFNI